MGVHCLAPYLMTLLLEPILVKTATSTDAKPSTVRIVFVVSLLSHGTPPGAMTFQADGVPVIRPKAMDNYMQSKVGSAWLAAEFAERLGKHGILSVVSEVRLASEVYADHCTELTSRVHEVGVAETHVRSRQDHHSELYQT